MYSCTKLSSLMATCNGVWAPTSLSYFTASFSGFLVLLVVAGNGFVMLAIARDPLKKLRSPFNYFLFNLALSDFTIGAITMPTSVKYHIQESYGQCKETVIALMHMSYFLSATTSVFSLAVLSIDRFCAIRWPIRYRRMVTAKRCALVCAAIWFTSAALTTFYLLIGYIRSLMVFIHTAVLVTLVILLLTYIQVYRAFRAQILELKRLKRASDAYTYNQLNTIRLEKKVTRAFLWILGCFIASYTPAIIMIYILETCTHCDCTLWHCLRDATFLIVSANSGMNPLVCAFRLKVFRRSIALAFKRKVVITLSSSIKDLGIETAASKQQLGQQQQQQQQQTLLQVASLKVNRDESTSS
uniref:Biogenic amine-like GPCR n=1 Tax=Tripedalia cystophora TaxID=6141 RepID=A0A481ZLQ2_TRICY|nr:biogenic amine-like GPCR [Tripedalia cystophora]